MRRAVLITAVIMLLTATGAAETTIYTGETVDIRTGDGEQTIELRAVTDQSQAAVYVNGELIEVEAGETFQAGGQPVPIISVEQYGQQNGSMTINASLADDRDDTSDPGGILTIDTGERQMVTVSGEEYELEPRAVTDGPNIALYINGRLSEHTEDETFHIGGMEVIVDAIVRDGSGSTDGRLRLNMTGYPGDADDDADPIEWEIGPADETGQDDDEETSEPEDETGQDDDGQERPGTMTIRTGETAVITVNGQEYEIEPRAVTDGPNIALYINGRLSEHTEDETFQIGGRAVAILTIERLSGEDGTGRVTINTTGRLEDDPVDTPVERPENGSQPAPRSIELTEGWNTISVASQLQARELAEQCSLQRYQDELVWQYRDGGWTHPTTLQPQEGYYVNAAERCKATYTPTSTAETTDSIQLTAGWNMIGAAEPVRAEAISGQCTVRRYQGSALLAYSDGWQETATDDLLDPETGYFINVAEPCVLDQATGDQ